MTLSTSRCLLRLIAVLMLATVPVALVAAPSATKIIGHVPATPAIDAFDAIKSGQISVKFIPQSDTKANVLVENKTKQPLTIKLPDAFAGVPVLAQAAPADAGQAAGAAGGPAFNVPPEATRKVTVPTLCLEHGKRDPSPKMAYEMKPLEAVSTKPEVRELITRYGRGDVPVKAAQAAAWHLQNEMTWQELAAKELRHARRPNEPYFTRTELAQAVQLVKAATDKVKASGEQPRSPSDVVGSASR